MSASPLSARSIAHGCLSNWAAVADAHLSQSNEATIQIELAVSRDGIRWTRPFRNEYFLPCNTNNAFDGDSNGHGAERQVGMMPLHVSAQASGPSHSSFLSDVQCCLWTSATPQLVNDKLRFYYGGYSNGLALDKAVTSGIGLATIPLDRFAGVRPIQSIKVSDDSQDSRRELTFCAPHRACSAANGSVDHGVYSTVPCKVDLDCKLAQSCNGAKVVCTANGLCGAGTCTKSGAGSEPGSVGCGLVCQCDDHGGTTACIGPQNDDKPNAGIGPLSIGQVTFRPRPIQASVCELLVNADTQTPGSSVSVEILDSMGFRVRGFGANGGANQSEGIHEAIPITGVDTLNATARWKTSSRAPAGAPAVHSIKSLPEGRYMVRVFLAGRATLYSLTFSEQC